MLLCWENREIYKPSENKNNFCSVKMSRIRNFKFISMPMFCFIKKTPEVHVKTPQNASDRIEYITTFLYSRFDFKDCAVLCID